MAGKKLGPSSSVGKGVFPPLLLILQEQHFHPYTAGKINEPELQVKTQANLTFDVKHCVE